MIKHQGPFSTQVKNLCLKSEPIPSIISLTILFENNVTGKSKAYICMSYVPTRNLHRRFLDIFHLTLLMPDKFSIWLPKSSVPQTRSNQCIRTFKSSNKRGLLAFTSISPAPLIGDHHDTVLCCLCY